MDARLRDLKRSLGIGAISGLRSMAGPAFVARAAYDGRVDLQNTRLAFLASPWAAGALTVLQAGEMVGDKLPSTPSRTGPGPLLGRAGAGALAGAAVAASEGRRTLAGALVGAGSAVVAAFAGERLRSLVGEKTGAPDPLVGTLEDVVVLAAGFNLTRSSER